MNYRVFVFLTIICCVCTSLRAAPFKNLNFEQGSFQTPPANYVPTTGGPYPYSISAAAGLPFWTARVDSTVCTAIWGNTGPLDETGVTLLSNFPIPPQSFAVNPLNGNYSVELSAVSFAPPDLYKISSISQIGDVPAGAQSIQFLMTNYGGPVSSNALVTLNGSTINLVPIATNGYVVTMAGDVSAFAGTNAELTITSAGTPGGGPLSGENVFALDDISFSPNIIPEPSTIALLTLGGIGLIVRKRLRSSK